ncbi:hypothetical protein LY78DRAFT_669225 [Colletotrichum sublineola]|nr:hypothetical protein LY78DRAFT_669225 [Colletotrichum sublineola]
MASDGKFGLWYKRHKNNHYPAVIKRITKVDTTFYQRQQDALEKCASNRFLDDKSTEIEEELHQKLWALMYLPHIIERIDNADPVHIEFSDLPDLQTLRATDAKSYSASSIDEFAAQPDTLQTQILEQRLRDARIGKEEAWVALNALINKLTLSKLLLTNTP